MESNKVAMIKKDTPCYLSELGHNNFFYPIFNHRGMRKFSEDLVPQQYKIQPWVSGMYGLVAVAVETSMIEDVKGEKASSVLGHKRIVVWVNKNDLPG
jgi:hypothetical protein